MKIEKMKGILSYPAKNHPWYCQFHDYTWKRASLCTITSFPLWRASTIPDVGRQHFSFGHSVHHVCRPEGLRLYNGGFCLWPFCYHTRFGYWQYKTIGIGTSRTYFPLYGHENGVLGRDGHTEALLDLTRMAGLTPGGALIEILNQDGTMARLPQLLEIAEKFQLKIIAIKDIQEYRRNNKI